MGQCMSCHAKAAAAAAATAAEGGGDSSSSAKRSSSSKGEGQGPLSFARRVAALAKEQRARFYILRRCVTMLLCWHIYGRDS